ncbi:MAG: hypothetical protein ACLPZM_01635 [Thermoplasmata archaeon]
MTFVPFSSADLAALRWLKVADSPIVYTLSSGDQALAQLRWANRTGSLAHAETEAARWTLERGGFLNPHVTLRTTDSEAVLARVSVHLNHHEIKFASGANYRFRRSTPHLTGILVPAWLVTTEEGTELAHIEPVREGRHLTVGGVVVAPDGTRCPDLAALLIVTWYFVVLSWFEDEAMIPLEGLDKV